MRKKKIISFLTATFVFVLALLFYPLINLFELKRVIVVSKMTEMKGLSELNGNNLLFVRENKIASLIINKNLTLKSVSIKKIYPSTLLLIPMEKSYKAKIKSNDSMILVDEDSLVLLDQNIQSSDFPVIEVRNIPLSLNQRADWRIERAITLFDQLMKYGISSKDITLDGNESFLKVTTVDGTEITISDKDDVYRIAASLQIIFNRFRIEGKNIRVIDLRFDKPVVILGSGEKISSGLEL